MPYFLSATGVTVYIHDFALRLELVMTVNRTRQCGQVLEAQDGNGVPIPTVVPTGAAPVRALQGCVLATAPLHDTVVPRKSVKETVRRDL